jgi:hypothetical protein
MKGESGFGFLGIGRRGRDPMLSGYLGTGDQKEEVGFGYQVIGNIGKLKNKI